MQDNRRIALVDSILDHIAAADRSVAVGRYNTSVAHLASAAEILERLRQETSQAKADAITSRRLRDVAKALAAERTGGVQ